MTMILQTCGFISVAAFFRRIYGNPASSIPFHRCNEELSPKLKSNVHSLEHIHHEFLLPPSITETARRKQHTLILRFDRQ